jgi:hypothetical protein
MANKYSRIKKSGNAARNKHKRQKKRRCNKTQKRQRKQRSIKKVIQTESFFLITGKNTKIMNEIKTETEIVEIIDIKKPQLRLGLMPSILLGHIASFLSQEDIFWRFILINKYFRDSVFAKGFVLSYLYLCGLSFDSHYDTDFVFAIKDGHISYLFETLSKVNITNCKFEIGYATVATILYVFSKLKSLNVKKPNIILTRCDIHKCLKSNYFNKICFYKEGYEFAQQARIQIKYASYMPTKKTRLPYSSINNCSFVDYYINEHEKVTEEEIQKLEFLSFELNHFSYYDSRTLDDEQRGRYERMMNICENKFTSCSLRREEIDTFFPNGFKKCTNLQTLKITALGMNDISNFADLVLNLRKKLNKYSIKLTFVFYVLERKEEIIYHLIDSLEQLTSKINFKCVFKAGDKLYLSNKNVQDRLCVKKLKNVTFFVSCLDDNVGFI